VDAAALRAEFPVLGELAYLNAGTNGPVPARARRAAEEAIRLQTEAGRGGSSFFVETLLPAAESLRERVAGLLGCQADELALTGSTTDGVNSVVAGLELGPGDEVLTSDEEHPGLLVPLALGARRRGFRVRNAPFAELAGETGPATRLIACSHVSWVNGQVADCAALGADDALLLLDGAQGLGAVATDVRALGCDFYAASGQKWLCGPNGTGYLYVRSERLAQLTPAWPGYATLAAPARPLDLELREGAQRLDLGLLPFEHAAWAAAALDVLEGPGHAAVLDAAAARAQTLAERLAQSGRAVAPRGRSTLVSWEEGDPPAVSARLAERGVVVRHLPETPYVRASVGAWNDEEDLERLLSAL
jgi:L-cysteine/cystine lyase